MQCIVVKSDEFENSLPLYIFPLNPDYVAARSLRSLRSNYKFILLSDILDTFIAISEDLNLKSNASVSSTDYSSLQWLGLGNNTD